MDPHSLLILHFYRQVTAGHPQRFVLLRKLQARLEKLQQQLKQSELQLLQDPFSDLQESSFSHLQNDFDSAFLKAAEPRWSCNWLFSSKKIEKTLFFGIIHCLICHQNILDLKLLTELLEQQIVACSPPQQAVRFIYEGWSKILNLSSRTKSQNWERILCNLVKRMPQELNMLLANLLPREEDSSISKIAATFKVRVTFMELKGRKILRSAKYGTGNGQIIICYINEVGRYTVSNHCPSQTKSDILKREVAEQLRLGLQNLQQVYEQGTSNIKQLSFFGNGSCSELKVISFLSKT